MMIHYKRLVKVDEGGNLKEILEKLIIEHETRGKEFKSLENDIEDLQKESRVNLKKIGLYKYNPFNEKGGKQSFALCLLNDQLDGCLITGIQSRDYARVYIKEILKGKSTVELSTEEKKALNNAAKNK